MNLESGNLMLKTNGITYKKFLADDSYWKDLHLDNNYQLTINGQLADKDDLILVSDIPDASLVESIGGYVYNSWEGKVSTESSFFKKWLKLQKISYLLIEVLTEDKEELLDLLKKTKTKIIG